MESNNIIYFTNKYKEGSEVPELSEETYVSEDYANNFNFLISAYKYKGIKMVKDIFKRMKDKGTPFYIKKYEEVYSVYKNVVNDKNRKTVKRLDVLVDLLNEVSKDTDSIDEENFRHILNEISHLVYGEKYTRI